ncbi:MAG: hypothetical protein AB7J30_06465 [Hyphomicrobium sp.]|uniref:hypothetical protein n=1 Tax=Hyphomicrobium sp. TaxID=82 RepID=UPI003D120E4B
MTSVIDQFPSRLKAARERLIETNINDPALTYLITGLARVEDILRRPPRVVILGESNSGKTSVADLLLGHGLLPTSVVSNTRMPVLIGYAEKPAVFGVDEDDTRIRIDANNGDALTDLSYRALQISLPIEQLRSFQILDTPPSVSPAAFVGEADLVIWCTVATRAWTESERAAWFSLPQRASRNAILVATHKDGLETDDDMSRVTSRLKSLTNGQFRDVILVDAEGVGEAATTAANDEWSGALELRDGVRRAVADIIERRGHKAEKIVRRLARLTFHHFASGEVRTECVMLLARWETFVRHQLEQLRDGRQTTPQTIETLLTAYAIYAEKLRPGVVTGDSVPASSSGAGTLTAPMRWPRQTTAAARLVETLASDLTGLLRMLSGHSTFTDPAVVAEYATARAIVLTLADLDGAFDALGRMLGSPMVTAKAS